jgi:hypothetical protein
MEEGGMEEGGKEEGKVFRISKIGFPLFVTARIRYRYSIANRLLNDLLQPANYN